LSTLPKKGVAFQESGGVWATFDPLEGSHDALKMGEKIQPGRTLDRKKNRHAKRKKSVVYPRAGGVREAIREGQVRKTPAAEGTVRRLWNDCWGWGGGKGKIKKKGWEAWFAHWGSQAGKAVEGAKGGALVVGSGSSWQKQGERGREKTKKVGEKGRIQWTGPLFWDQ